MPRCSRLQAQALQLVLLFGPWPFDEVWIQDPQPPILALLVSAVLGREDGHILEDSWPVALHHSQNPHALHTHGPGHCGSLYLRVSQAWMEAGKLRTLCRATAPNCPVPAWSYIRDSGLLREGYFPRGFRPCGDRSEEWGQGLVTGPELPDEPGKPTAAPATSS